VNRAFVAVGLAAGLTLGLVEADPVMAQLTRGGKQVVTTTSTTTTLAPALEVEPIPETASEPTLTVVTTIPSPPELGIFSFANSYYGTQSTEKDQTDQYAATKASVALPRGYVWMPDPNELSSVSSDRPSFGWFANTCPTQRAGSAVLVATLADTIQEWNQTHPELPLIVGDLNASSHSTHRNGRNADLFGGSPELINYTAKGLTVDTLQSRQTSKYSSELTAELGKLLISKNVESILYNDPRVAQIVNDFAKSSGLDGRMRAHPNHNAHFHLTVPGKDLSTFVPRCEPARIFPGGF
jgi:hypothetical protein